MFGLRIWAHVVKNNLYGDGGGGLCSSRRLTMLVDLMSSLHILRVEQGIPVEQ